MEEETPATGSRSQQKPKEGPHHVGVVCDGCGSEIYGVRYKCLVCPDFDLCSACERKGEHVEHNMVSIRDPLNYSPWGARPFGGPWRGRRGHHCRGRGRHGGPWAHPFFLQNLFGGLWGAPGGPPCGQQPGEEKTRGEGKSEEMDMEQQTPGEPSGEQTQLGREQQQSYLQDIGQAVSNFLRPFGVKVDVDVVEGQAKKSEAATNTPADPTPSTPSKVPSGYDGSTVSETHFV